MLPAFVDNSAIPKNLQSIRRTSSKADGSLKADLNVCQRIFDRRLWFLKKLAGNGDL
jgi:hypothetical protein